MKYKKHPLSPEAFQEKRYELTKELLSARVSTLDSFNALGEDKQLSSLISNCIFMADGVLAELGYFSRDPEMTEIRTLNSILRPEEE